MFNKLYQSFRKSAKVGNALILLLSCLVFTGVVLPWASSELKSASSETTRVDLPFSYTTEQLYTILKSYGSQGREWYTLMELTIFTIYPLLCSMLTGVCILMFYSRLHVKDNLIKIFFVLPLVSLLANWIENICMVFILVNYPYKLETVVKLANICAQTKWIFLVVSIGTAVAGGMLMLIRYIRFKFTVRSIPR